MQMRLYVLLGFALSFSACAGPSDNASLYAAVTEHDHADNLARVRQDSINRTTPGYIVDSIFTIDEHLKRFRKGLDEVSAFSGGERTPHALVQSIVRGIENADTALLVRLAVTQAEFAWLVYPESPYTRPPLRQAPEIVWYLQAGESYKGLRRLLDRLGNTSLGYVGFNCSDPIAQGRNTILTGCVVEQTSELYGKRLFGQLIERGGRWKVLSYANGY